MTEALTAFLVVVAFSRPAAAEPTLPGGTISSTSRPDSQDSAQRLHRAPWVPTLHVFAVGVGDGGSLCAHAPQPNAADSRRNAGPAGVHIVVTTPAASPAQGSDGDLAEVRRLINAGEAREALERLRKVTGSTEEERSQIALLRGVAHYHADEPAAAVEALAPVVDHLPAGTIERREAEQVLGLALFVTGRYADAVPRLEATRAWAPGNLELAYALGQAYIHVRRPEEARGALASVYGVQPESAAAHLIAAQTMVRLQMDPLAEPELARALEKDPRLPAANLLLGQIALFRGRLEEAVALTSREIDVNPANGMAFSQLGDAYVRQGKWEDAIAALQKSIWLNPYYSAPYILLGRAYMKKGEPSAAEAMLRRAVQYDPNNRAAHYLLGQLLQQMGRTEEARRAFAVAEQLRETRGP